MNIKALSFATALALSAVSMQASAVNDGTINIDGVITDVTCKVEGADPGTGNGRKDVDLLGASPSRLANAGDRANLTGFNIKVGGDGDGGCTDGRKAMVAFDLTSPAIDVATGRLNTDVVEGNATNLQVEITSSKGVPLNVYTDRSEAVVIANNQAVIPLAAQYYATGAVTEGPVATRVGFVIEYAE